MLQEYAAIRVRIFSAFHTSSFGGDPAYGQVFLPKNASEAYDVFIAFLTNSAALLHRIHKIPAEMIGSWISWQLSNASAPSWSSVRVFAVTCRHNAPCPRYGCPKFRYPKSCRWHARLKDFSTSAQVGPEQPSSV